MGRGPRAYCPLYHVPEPAEGVLQPLLFVRVVVTMCVINKSPPTSEKRGVGRSVMNFCPL